MALRIRGTGKGGCNSEQNSTFTIRLTTTGKRQAQWLPEGESEKAEEKNLRI